MTTFGCTNRRHARKQRYTYKEKDYPKEIRLYHPEIEEILSKDFDLMTLSGHGAHWGDGAAEMPLDWNTLITIHTNLSAL